jgi:DNA-binding MarR family transcriptional regulator
MNTSAGEQMNVVTALVRASFLIDAVYTASAREFGLTQQQGQLLCVLMGRPYGMTELGATLGLAKSSLTGLVDRTSGRGLARREPDPEDGRALRVALTADGAALAERFYAATCRRVEQLTSGLPEADRELLAGLLGRLVRDNEVPAVFLELDETAPAEPGG